MKTKAWTLIPLITVISCTADEPGPGDAGRVASFDATIETFAGTTFGYEGDGGDAKSAKLGYLTGLSIDASGNMYISDGAANTIRKINTSNVISTIAGTFLGWNVADQQPYSGDGGPATSAHLNAPWGVAADPGGNVFICDAANNVLRMVNTSGIISTIAGKAYTQGHSGDNGPASQALIYNPSGITADEAGNVYLVDAQNHAIRKISVSGEITTIAGTPGEAGYSGDGGPATAAKLSMPQGIAIDKIGNLYISDNNSVIRRITQGRITTIAGTGVEGFSGDGGKATEAKLLAPKGVAIASDGSVVFADSGNSRIRRITPETELIETIAGTGKAGYSGDGGPAIEAEISIPLGIAVDASGNIYVAESGNAVVRIIKPAK